MPTPRSTAHISQAPGAVCNFTFNGQTLALPIIAANSATTLTLALPRRFKPHRQTTINTVGVLPAGVSLDGWQVTGNSPTSGAPVLGYTLTLVFQNNATAASVAGSTQIRVIQL